MTTLLTERDVDSDTPPHFKGPALPRMERVEFLRLPGLQLPQNGGWDFNYHLGLPPCFLWGALSR